MTWKVYIHELGIHAHVTWKYSSASYISTRLSSYISSSMVLRGFRTLIDIGHHAGLSLSGYRAMTSDRLRARMENGHGIEYRGWMTLQFHFHRTYAPGPSCCSRLVLSGVVRLQTAHPTLYNFLHIMIKENGKHNCIAYSYAQGKLDDPSAVTGRKA